MMSNPIFDMMRGFSAPAQHPASGNIWQQFQQFRQNLNGNPEQIVKGLLQSGRMTEQQFQQFGQMANQIMKK